MNLEKVIKLTQAQYDILAAGGTVGSYTGLDDSYIYLIEGTDFTGATGPKGATGPRGYTGPDGGQGPRGYTGYTGPQGGQGPRGYTGPSWSPSSYVSSVNSATGAVSLGDTTGLNYLTTAPSSANTSGMKIVVLSSEPSTKYNGYLYIII